MNKSARKKPAVLKISRVSSTIIGPLRIQGPFSWSKKTPSSARASTNRDPTKSKPDEASTTPGSNRTLGALHKAIEPLPLGGISADLRQTRATLPKTKIPIFSGYGNKGSASINSGPVHTEGKKPATSAQASASPSLAQTTEPKDSDSESSDKASATPGTEQTRELKPSETASPNPSTSPSHHKTKIPISSERRIREEYSSSVIRNGGSAFRYLSVVQAQGPVLPARTPTCPSILQTRRPPPNTSESVFMVLRNRGSVSTSPSYKRRPKPSAPDNTDRGLQASKSVSSVNKSASRNPGPLQTKRPLPKSIEPVSSVKRNRGSSSKSPGRTVSSKRTSASPAPAQTQGLKANGSITSTNNYNYKRPGVLRTRIPIPSPGPYGKQNRNTKPECSAKQNLKSSSPRSTNHKPKLTPKTNLALETQLADELDRRNRSINELEMKLVQNENLVSEQALRLAESKADQRAKDVAMEQLKSELFSAKDEYSRMQLRLKEADLGLEQATCKVNKYLEQSTTFENELKDARNKIVNLQMQLRDANTKAENDCQIKAQLHQDVERLQEQLALDSKRIDSLQHSEKDLREDLGKKDGLINQINHELATRDEEFRNLFETLQNKHTQLRNQELNIKRLEERHERNSLNRSKLEERNTALLDKIERLKHNLRYYSHMIIANDGKPFYEEVGSGVNPDTVNDIDPSPEEEPQQKRKPKPRELV